MDNKLFTKLKLILQQDGLKIKDMPEAIDNQKLGIIAVKQNGLALQYLSEELRNDENIVKEAIKNNPKAIKYIGEKLKTNYKFLFKIIRIQNEVYDNLDIAIKLKLDFTIRLLNECKRANIKLPDEIINNRENVLELAKHCPNVLNFTNNLYNDDEIAIEIVKKDGLQLCNLSDRLKDNKEIVLEAVKQNGLALQYASERLRDDEEIVLKAVRQNADAFKYASDRLKDKEEFIRQLLQINGLVIKHLAVKYRQKEEFNVLALKQNPNALKDLYDVYKNTPTIVFDTIVNHPKLFGSLGEDLQIYKPFVLKLLEYNYLIYNFLNNKLKNDNDVKNKYNETKAKENDKNKRFS